MWEQSPEPFLNDPVLLPFASLTQTQNPEQLLDLIAQAVINIPQTEERKQVSAYVQLMAGLKYDERVIRSLFREGIMRESVIYQEILQEGVRIGEARGQQIGEEQGRQSGQRSLIRLLLEQRFGQLSQEQIDRISTLNSEQLETLAIALLNFSEVSELETWLINHSEPLSN